jgi:hypothetical protein
MFGKLQQYFNNEDFSILKGKTLTKIENKKNEEIYFFTNEGEVFRQYYDPD